MIGPTTGCLHKDHEVDVRPLEPVSSRNQLRSHNLTRVAVGKAATREKETSPVEFELSEICLIGLEVDRGRHERPPQSALSSFRVPGLCRALRQSSLGWLLAVSS